VASRGYSSVSLVVQELGRDLTGTQYDEIEGLLEEAEHIADREAGRIWLGTSITGESHRLVGRMIQLNYRPVTAISSVAIRRLAVGATSTALAVGTGYDLVDTLNGVIVLAGYGPGNDIIINTETMDDGPYIVTVSYTATPNVPASIRRGVTKLVAHWMLNRLDPDRQGLESYSVGSDYQVRMRDDADDIPEGVLRLFRQHRAILIA
jgi:hypothetical protein